MIDKEILDGFKEETSTLLKESLSIIAEIEDTNDQVPKKLIEEFANRMDRIMGTTKTFELMAPEIEIFATISKFAELCKATGYKASIIEQKELIPIFAAFWSDTVEMIEKLCQNIENESTTKSLLVDYVPVLQKRLTWLAQQIVKLTKNSKETTAINVDGILRKMGLIN